MNFKFPSLQIRGKVKKPVTRQHLRDSSDSISIDTTPYREHSQAVHPDESGTPLYIGTSKLSNDSHDLFEIRSNESGSVSSLPVRECNTRPE